MTHKIWRSNFKPIFREAELLTLRNTPFDGRKCIWVPSKDEEVSYAPATIIGEGSKVGFYSDWLGWNEFWFVATSNQFKNDFSLVPKKYRTTEKKKISKKN